LAGTGNTAVIARPNGISALKLKDKRWAKKKPRGGASRSRRSTTNIKGACCGKGQKGGAGEQIRPRFGSNIDGFGPARTSTGRRKGRSHWET